MAVPFYIPEQNDGADASSIPNNYPNTTSSATQTPLPSPIGREHLVQAFYDALYRCGSPTIIQGQSCNTPLFVYDQRDMFFQNTNENILNNSTVNEELQQRSPFTYQRQNSTESPRNPIGYSGLGYGPDLIRNEIDERFEHYMLEREKLEEFPGRLPLKKKKKEKARSKCASFQNLFKWSTVVTVVVIAMGCGLLVTR